MSWLLISIIIYFSGIAVLSFLDGLFHWDFFEIGSYDDSGSFFCLFLWPLLLIVLPIYIFYIVVGGPVSCLGTKLRRKIVYLLDYRHVIFCRKSKLAYYLTSSDEKERIIARRRMGKK